ncbi:hypothetical protein J6590_099608 [Homalodisca vitripennis]|nr:hypothetical protein J6590_099608 [Homalodisca vitripennis]
METRFSISLWGKIEGRRCQKYSSQTDRQTDRQTEPSMCLSSFEFIARSVNQLNSPSDINKDDNCLQPQGPSDEPRRNGEAAIPTQISNHAGLFSTEPRALWSALAPPPNIWPNPDNPSESESSHPRPPGGGNNRAQLGLCPTRLEPARRQFRGQLVASVSLDLCCTLITSPLLDSCSDHNGCCHTSTGRRNVDHQANTTSIVGSLPGPTSFWGGLIKHNPPRTLWIVGKLNSDPQSDYRLPVKPFEPVAGAWILSNGIWGKFDGADKKYEYSGQDLNLRYLYLRSKNRRLTKRERESAKRERTHTRWRGGERSEQIIREQPGLARMDMLRAQVSNSFSFEGMGAGGGGGDCLQALRGMWAPLCKTATPHIL